MSLAAWSLPLATEPYTKAAVIFPASGASADWIGATSPTVLRTSPVSSANTGEPGLAW